MTHALEIGLSFLLFVIAISTFIFMYGQTMALVDATRSHKDVEQQIGLHEGHVAEELTSLEDIYVLLTAGELGGNEHWVNESSYISSAGHIKITIDGVDFSPVKDYRGQQSLKASLQSLTSHSFDKDYYVNDDGKLIEIRFTGR